jgi:hypothetical protein
MSRARVDFTFAEAEAVLEALGRGIDEWEAELEDPTGSVHGSLADARKALRGWQKINTSLEASRGAV